MHTNLSFRSFVVNLHVLVFNHMTLNKILFLLFHLYWDLVLIILRHLRTCLLMLPLCLYVHKIFRELSSTFDPEN